MNQTLLKKYADFIVRVGVNVQPGQNFFIRCPVTEAGFARLCARAGYEAGAKRVIVRYEDQALARIQYEMGSLKALTQFMPSQLRCWLDYAEDEGSCCILAIHADDPKAFDGLDAGKLNQVSLARRNFLQSWQNYTMNDRIQWCVASIPTAAWAAQVLPGLTPEQAVERLWEIIFQVCRVDEDSDPVENWKQHVSRLEAYKDRLNQLDLESVHFQSANGTDLTVGLADDAVWEAAQSRAENGAVFIANVPTEEVFTAPHRLHVSGVVKGTKPYVYNGQLIEGFSVTFLDGKVVEYSAEKNRELLGELLTTDENACRIGEVALVPASSPINRSGMIFYNTLFDENAACHIAFGDGYPGTVRGGNGMSQEQLLAHGVNHSAIHEDVMVGSEDMTITGLTRRGESVLLFRSGEWALEM